MTPALRPWLAISVLSLAIALPSARAAAGATFEGLRLAPATPGAVRFTVDVPEPRLESVGTDGARRLQLDGFDLRGDPGGPALPERVVTVAVPPLGDVQVSAVGSSGERLDDLLLAANDLPNANGRPGDPTTLPVAPRDPRLYARSVPLAQPRARLVALSWLRNQRVAEIAITPASYDPATRTLALDRRVDVELRFDPVGSLGSAAEPQDPFEFLYARTLPNYEQGRSWRRPETRAFVAAARARGLSAESAAGIALLADTSLFVGRGWVKLVVRRTGFHRVRYGQLKVFQAFQDANGSPDTSIVSDSLRLFTIPGRPVIPESTFCDTCQFREVAIGVVDGGQDPGQFDSDGDYLYFFAHGPNDWEDRYDPSQPDTSYFNHPYETRNYYYLTVATASAPMPGAPHRIATRDVTPVVDGNETQPATFQERVHFEQDNDYWPDVTNGDSALRWEKWFWRAFGLLGSPTFQPFTAAGFDLPYADTTQAARFRMRVWGLTRIYDRNNCVTTTDPDHLLDVTLNSVVFPRRAYVGSTSGINSFEHAGQTWDTTGVLLRRTGNLLTLTIPPLPNPQCPVRNDQSGLAWVDCFYRRTFTPVLDSLDFRSEPGPGRYLYRLGPYADIARQPRLFDVTDPLSPIELTGATYTSVPSGPELAFEDVQADRRVYRTVSDTLFTDARSLMVATDLSEAAATSFVNLRSRTNRARYVVVYYDAFKAAADSLVAWRSLRLPTLGAAPHATKAIPISALYDQFSGGRIDPGAMRSFLRTALFNWAEAPAFVTLLGDASYDFKNIKGYAGVGQPGTLMPSYENGFDTIVGRQFATDDWMLAVNDTRNVIPDFFGGRIPANDANSALDVVRSKILAYERSVPLGEYRNRALLLADDDYQGTACDDLGWTHLAQTTELDTTRIPLHMDRDYVYLNTYPQGANGSRPGARIELKQLFDQGIGLFNYFGHGSPFKLTDESVFLDTDASTLLNLGKLPLFTAASCDVGKFNDPTIPSLGERILMTPTNGAIAVISATELAFSNQNRDLSQQFYQLLFDRDTLSVPALTPDVTGEYYVPHSAALLGAKILTGGFARTSLRKYQVMGDAATVVNLPRYWTDITLEDAQGGPVADVQRGQQLVLRGRILDHPGGTPLAFDGTVSVLLEDSAPIDRAAIDPCRSVGQLYRYRAGAIFRGDVSVRGGTFSTPFIVPLDATEGPRGKARAYFTGRAQGRAVDEDGAGAVATRIVPGAAASTDVEGPRISLAFVGGALAVRPDATLRIDLFDESGILTTGHTPQNGIVLTLDDNSTTRYDVTSSFRYAADSYQGGVASFQLPDLAAGPHHLTVSAADNLALGLLAGQHRSSAALDFEVVNSPPLNVARAYLFPNPLRVKGPGAGGTFVVDAPGDSVNTMVRVYTVSGKLIRTLQRFGAIGQIQLPWDGRDEEGAPLANGTYLFKVYVNVRDELGESSARQKAVAQGRLVVLN